MTAPRKGPKAHPERRARLAAAAMSVVGFVGLAGTIAQRAATTQATPTAGTSTSASTSTSSSSTSTTIGSGLPGSLIAGQQPVTSSHAS
jgi:hypothetical protein